MTINTGDINRELRPGLNAVFGNYEMYPAKWKDYFKTRPSHMNFERLVENKYLSIAKYQPEGTPVSVDTMGERIVTEFHHKTFSNSFNITFEAYRDNLYKSMFPQAALSLRQSLEQAEEVGGASVFNNGFSPNFPLGDGQPLFSTQHPIDGGVYANTPPVRMDLSEAAVEQAVTAIQLFENQAGLLVRINAKFLAVSAQGQWTGQRLIGSQYRTGTANNDISALYSLQSLPEGIKINPFFTIPSFWAVITDAPESFIKFNRDPMQQEVQTDFSTRNIQFQAYHRYSYGCANPRGAYGSQGLGV
ncbi:MAG TPA: hypothetical protein VHA52_09995 [Candidatus Babeliaceae bacterium]|nr:hypothetical protein [Candidatus Babeliaceae bacterium]